MPLDDALIRYLEDLTCLTLRDEERRRLTADLQSILGYVERLAQVDTENIPEQSHPFDDVNAFREDAAAPSTPRALILRNAPDARDGLFVAPRVPGEG